MANVKRGLGKSFEKIFGEDKVQAENENVATVSESGEIVAVGKGSCIIQVYTQNALVEEIKANVR